MPFVAETIQGRVLKANAARTVYVDSRGVVVKRFHNPSAVQALRDRRRAVSEHRLLAALAARELPVPRPLEVRRARGAWEVVMEWIPEAATLGAVLAGERRSPVPLEVLATRLGRLLARAHAAGLDHPDLHPGNVLIDADGNPWLVDFHKARLRSRTDPKLLERDLVALGAAVRELFPPRLRARFALAWRRALPDELASGLAEPARLARDVEDRARVRRRAVLAHAQGRWTRTSSSCVETARAFQRRDLPEDFAERLESASRHRSRYVEVALYDQQVRALVLRGRANELRARWYSAVRLCDHRVPALAPLCLSAHWAAFEIPAGAQPVAAAPSPQQLGALLGTLHDRGLDVDALDGLYEHGDALLLAPPPRLLHLDPRPGACAAKRRFEALRGAAVDAADPGLRAAYVAAFRHGAREGRRLAADVL